MVQIALIVLACADLLIDLSANLGMPLGLLLDKLEDIELLEVLCLLQLLNDLATLLVRVVTATRPDQKDRGLNTVAKLTEGLIEVLLRAHTLDIGLGLQVGNQTFSVLVVLSNTLRKNCRRLVGAVRLCEAVHTLLA